MGGGRVNDSSQLLFETMLHWPIAPGGAELVATLAWTSADPSELDDIVSRLEASVRRRRGLEPANDGMSGDWSWGTAKDIPPPIKECHCRPAIAADERWKGCFWGLRWRRSFPAEYWIRQIQFRSACSSTDDRKIRGYLHYSVKSGTFAGKSLMNLWNDSLSHLGVSRWLDWAGTVP